MRQAYCRVVTAHRMCHAVADELSTSPMGLVFRCPKGHQFRIQHEDCALVPEGTVIDRDLSKERARHELIKDRTAVPTTPSKANSNGNGVYDLAALHVESLQPITVCQCGGRSKLYRRKLNSGMAATLCWLVANGNGEWVHTSKMPRWAVVGREFGKLFFWGMMEMQEEDGDEKRSSGIYRVTEAGRAFAMEETDAPSHAFIRSPRSQFLTLDTRSSVTILEALGQKFHYAELMRGDG